jgi:hypothetical protein
MFTKYYSGDQIKKNKMGRSRSMFGEKRGAHRPLVQKPEKRSPLGRPVSRRENNIKTDLREVEWRRGGGRSGLDRPGLESGQMSGSCECGIEP